MFGQLLLAALLTLSIMFSAPAQSVPPVASTLKTWSFRLRPGQDLKEELDKIVQIQGIEAGAILTCVGSRGSHIHLSVSDSTGRTLSGHLLPGCKIYTTAELVIGILPDIVYTRKPDSAFGYKELVVRRKRKK